MVCRRRSVRRLFQHARFFLLVLRCYCAVNFHLFLEQFVLVRFVQPVLVVCLRRRKIVFFLVLLFLGRSSRRRRLFRFPLFDGLQPLDQIVVFHVNVVCGRRAAVAGFLGGGGAGGRGRG
uniref:(northern house mosquito) hypothetical protein n=1 Tax=Culex pipiens TaxID=7175 RepID=A0A8D8FNT3_CULPI